VIHGQDADGTTAIPDGPLTIAAGLRTRTDAAGHVLVETPLGGFVDAGPHGHAILALFSPPASFDKAVAALRSRPGPEPELMPIEATIVQLLTAGAIVAVDERSGARARFGWTDPAEHARMLDDERRTDAYLAAIRASVRPDDVVLDLGTGSGILAVAAAQAGARHTYAVEASDIAAVAQRVFEANGVADRVTLIEGWSTEIDLPEPASLLVTETLGVEPFEEDILRSVLDARRRLLRPHARLIPRQLRLQVQALAVPGVSRWASRVDEAMVEGWRQRYGVDLRALREARRRESLHWPVDSQVVASWQPLGPPVELLRIDLETFTSPAVRAGTRIVADRSGVVDAVLVTFSAELYDGIELVKRPQRSEHSSWDCSLWFLADAIEVAPGTVLAVEYRFGVPGEADGLSCQTTPAIFR
jgi:precorrin-6B methylase 2